METAWLDRDELDFMAAQLSADRHAGESTRALIEKAFAEGRALRAKAMEGCESKALAEWISSGLSMLLLKRTAFDALFDLLSPAAWAAVEGLPEPCVAVNFKLAMNAEKTGEGYSVDLDEIPNAFIGMPFFTLPHCSEAFKNEWERLGFRGLNFIPAGTLATRLRQPPTEGR